MAITVHSTNIHPWPLALRFISGKLPLTSDSGVYLLNTSNSHNLYITYKIYIRIYSIQNITIFKLTGKYFEGLDTDDCLKQVDPPVL